MEGEKKEKGDLILFIYLNKEEKKGVPLMANAVEKEKDRLKSQGRKRDEGNFTKGREEWSIFALELSKREGFEPLEGKKRGRRRGGNLFARYLEEAVLFSFRTERKRKEMKDGKKEGKKGKFFYSLLVREEKRGKRKLGSLTSYAREGGK